MYKCICTYVYMFVYPLTYFYLYTYTYIYIYIYKLSLYTYNMNIMHTTYLLVCRTEYKTWGLAHEAPPFMHLKNIACIRFMPLVNRLLWATVCI